MWGFPAPERAGGVASWSSAAGEGGHGALDAGQLELLADKKPPCRDKPNSRRKLDIGTGITVSRAPARALRALSRRFRGWIASLAPLRVHRPTRASGVGAEGVERIEGARRRR